MEIIPVHRLLHSVPFDDGAQALTQWEGHVRHGRCIPPNPGVEHISVDVKEEAAHRALGRLQRRVGVLV
eukprot:11200345-Lingulodinium_polyedra.AAC.1